MNGDRVHIRRHNMWHLCDIHICTRSNIESFSHFSMIFTTANYNLTTLSKISNGSLYIFMLVLKIRFGYAKLMLL